MCHFYQHWYNHVCPRVAGNDVLLGYKELQLGLGVVDELLGDDTKMVGYGGS